jgi:hypothetical protein
MLSALDSLLEIPSVVTSLDTIQIGSCSSPVGSRQVNRNLLRGRSGALHRYLKRNHPVVAESIPVRILRGRIDTAGYRALRSGGLSERQAWNLLQYTTVRLKMRDGSYIHPGAAAPVPCPGAGGEPYPVVAAGTGRDSVSIPVALEVSPAQAVEAAPPVVAVLAAVPAPLTSVLRGPDENAGRGNALRFALKTNLLYAAALLPNLSVGLPVGAGWSVGLSGYWSWWNTGSPSYWYHRVQWAGVELRRWKDARADCPPAGWFAGAYISGGNYDLRLFTDDLDDYGYLSHRSWSAGLTGGYSRPLSGRLHLEFSLNAGYFTGEYHAYNRSLCMDCFPERKTGTRHYWGPTGAGVSLVYLFHVPL